MKVVAIHDVTGDIQVSAVRERPPLPLELDDIIERHWLAAQRRTGGKLFNGLVFSADAITAAQLSGHFTEFRRIVAQMADPTLHTALGLRPLAVCGVVRCADGVVLGRRDRYAVYHAGMWQLPPAGSVDPRAVGPDGTIDLKRHLLTELEEELGWRTADITALRPLCMVEHEGSHVLDLGFAIDLAVGSDAVLTAHRGASDVREYDPLIVVAWAQLAEHVAGLGSDLVPTARIFLRQLGLIPA